MPRLKRRETQRRPDLNELTNGQRQHLIGGSTFFDDGFTDEESFRAAWEMHCEELTEEFNRESRSAGQSRPFGWWFCEHGKERPVINPAWSEAEVEGIRQRGGCNANHFGYLHSQCYIGLDAQGNMMPLLEEEWDYLERLDLLTDEEREFLESLDTDDD